MTHPQPGSARKPRVAVVFGGRSSEHAVSCVTAGAVLVDIRHPDEQELQPLTVQDVPVEIIPFYRLNSDFPALDQGKQYLLYCDKGLMSRLHASHLKDAGFENVAVYRP